MITLRLDSELEQHINNIAHQMGISKSELIRKSIKDYIGKFEQPTAWESGKDIFGKYASGNKNLSLDRKAIVREKISTKR